MLFIVFADTKLNGCVASVKLFDFIGGKHKFKRNKRLFAFLFFSIKVNFIAAFGGCVGGAVVLVSVNTIQIKNRVHWNECYP